MKTLRTAIFGCGSFAHKHVQVLQSMPEQFEVVAFCDRHLERAQNYAEKYGDSRTLIFTDHASLYEQAGLDVILISLPPYGHTDEVEQAAKRGIHIFIEKPIALTSEAAWKMVEDVEKAGVKTQVGFMLRFGAAVDALKQEIASGAAGPVGLMSARYFCNSLHSAWWRQREKSGGQLVEQVIHMVDLMRYLMGEPQLVFSLQNNVFHQHVPDYSVEDVSGTVMQFEQGGIGVIYATNGAIPGQWTNDYRVVTKNITAEFQDANHASFTYTGAEKLRTQAIASEQDNYRLQLLELAEAIRADGATRTPMREGARSLDLALAATQSAQSGQAVILGQ